MFQGAFEMRLVAFAALLALPLFTLAAPAAKADYYCCGPKHESFVTKDYHVIEKAVVFGCDGYHCQTNIDLLPDIHVKARCRNGWCEIRSLPFKNAWVLEKCLKPLHHYGRKPYPRKHTKPAHYDLEPAPRRYTKPADYERGYLPDRRHPRPY